nr:diguanylate cyclase [Evansella caseinilytica]
MGNLFEVNFTNLFHSLLEKNHSFENKFAPAVFFLADKQGKICSVFESAFLPQEMLEFFITVKHALMNGKTLPANDLCMLLTAEIVIPAGISSWNGKLGMIVLKSSCSAVEISSFLTGFKAAIPPAAKLVELEEKTKSLRKTVRVHAKMEQILKETECSDDFRLFVERYLWSVHENADSEGEVVFFLFDEARKAFLPEVSTDGKIVREKERYTLTMEAFQSLFADVAEQEIRIFYKADIPAIPMVQELESISDYLLLPVMFKGSALGIILYFVRTGSCHLQHIDEIVELTSALSPWMKRLLDYEEMMLEKTRKELLLKVNRKFYSCMDVNATLEEIVCALLEAYPELQVELLLSHDWYVAPHLSVQPFHFTRGDEGDLASLTYLTGELSIQTEKEKTVLYVPLKGKQGVYGVFHMEYKGDRRFLKKELEFIQVLADTGGNAIENTELYQQSQQYISNLQLINKTSHQLNQHLNLTEMVQYMVDIMQTTFEATDVGFIKFSDKPPAGDQVMDGSSSYFSSGTCNNDLALVIDVMKTEKEEIFIGNSSGNSLYISNYQSMMAVPMLHNHRVIGCVIVLSTELYAFSFDMFKLFKSLVHHSTLAFVNSLLHEELKQLVITDYLTKLYTREYMDQRIAESMKADLYGAFILMDIDRFKQINDQYGHQIGDEVIIQVAKVILAAIDEEKALAARWGGEELAVYLPEMQLEDAVKVAEAIKKNVKETTAPRVSVSCGVACWDRQAGKKSLKKLFNDADRAMYKAKNLGRDYVAY